MYKLPRDRKNHYPPHFTLHAAMDRPASAAVAFAAAATAITFALSLRAARKAHTKVRICVASCKELLVAAGGDTASYGNTGKDEANLYSALDANNVKYDVKAWDDSTVDWRLYDYVFVRTTWDYSTSERHATRFRQWLSMLCDLGVPVANHPRVLAWNCHKAYLQDMADLPAGVDDNGAAVGRIPVIPTVYIPAGCPPPAADLADITAAHGWRDILLKPCVGGGSRGCMRVRLDVQGQLEEGQAFLERHVKPKASGGSSSSSGASEDRGRTFEGRRVSPTATAALPRLGRHGSHGEHEGLSPAAARRQATKFADAAASANAGGWSSDDVTAQAEGAAGGAPHAVLDLTTPGTHDVAYTPCDMMVQPYIGSVEESGELSIITIDGRVCSVVVKTPAPGSYKTQEEHGGSPRARDSSTLSQAEHALVARVLATARACVERVEPPLGTTAGAGSPAARESLLPAPLPTTHTAPIMIARLDFLRCTPAVAASVGPGHGLHPDTTPLLLLELEAIEPCLFMSQGEGGQRTAAALVQAIRARTGV